MNQEHKEAIEDFIASDKRYFEVKMIDPKEAYYQTVEDASKGSSDFIHCNDDGDKFFISKLLGVIYHPSFKE